MLSVNLLNNRIVVNPIAMPEVFSVFFNHMSMLSLRSFLRGWTGGGDTGIRGGGRGTGIKGAGIGDKGGGGRGKRGRGAGEEGAEVRKFWGRVLYENVVFY